jgi:hypothetical protein
MLSLNSDSFLNVVKTYDLKSHKYLHFHKVMVIQRIPGTSQYLASADKSSIAKIDYAMDRVTYFDQHIDYVLTLAVSSENLYLSSSDSGLLCLGDHTNAKFRYFFSTKSYQAQYNSHSIDVSTFIAFQPQRQYYAFASTQQKFIYFFDGVYQRIFNRLEFGKEISCLHHVKGTSFIGIGNTKDGNELYFISLDSREEYFRESIGAKFVIVDAYGLKLGQSDQANPPKSILGIDHNLTG